MFKLSSNAIEFGCAYGSDASGTALTSTEESLAGLESPNAVASPLIYSTILVGKTRSASDGSSTYSARTAAQLSVMISYPVNTYDTTA